LSEVSFELKCTKGTISSLLYFGAHTGKAGTKLVSGHFKNYEVGNAFCGNPEYLPEDANCGAMLKPDFEELFAA
jgi:hypothetical protein